MGNNSMTDQTISGINKKTFSEQEKIKDLCEYIKYCFENTHLEKEKKVTSLIKNYVPDLNTTNLNSGHRFIRKFIEFLKELENLHEEKNRFNIAIYRLIPEIKYKPDAQDSYSIRSLIGLLLKRNNNKGFLMYKEYLQQAKKDLVKTMSTLPEEDLPEDLPEDFSRIKKSIPRVDIGEYDEKIQIGVYGLERKYLSFVTSTRNKEQAERMAIKNFKEEESKNYSETEIDKIIGLFYQTIGNVISNQVHY